MKPGRKPLPATVHYLNGNPSKLAAGRLLDQVTPETALPEPPETLDAVALAEWHRVGAELLKLGLVAQVDRAALAMYCAWWSRWVAAETKLRELGPDGMIDRTPNGFRQMSAWLQVSNQAAEKVHKYLTEFGMSPSARSRVTAGDPQMDLFDNDNGDSDSDGDGGSPMGDPARFLR